MVLRHGVVWRWLAVVWQASPPLVAASLWFLVHGGGSVLGLVLDGRQVAGSPAWLKPTKFSISLAIYCMTLAAVFTQVGRPSRGMTLAGWAVALSLAMEMLIITLQAARGMTSHFNFATPLDGGLFAVMGAGIIVLLIASALIAVELCRLEFADRAWGWALRLGMLVTVGGAATGGFMLGPTPAQQVEVGAATQPATRGAHTVGAADGGPGLPVVGWSRDHGDLRVPHFFGLHAIQAIPLLAWLGLGALRPRSEGHRLALVGVVAGSYLALIVLLAVQALAGRPVLGGDATSLRHLGLWVGGTAGAVALIAARVRVRCRNPLLMAGG